MPPADDLAALRELADAEYEQAQRDARDGLEHVNDQIGDFVEAALERMRADRRALLARLDAAEAGLSKMEAVLRHDDRIEVTCGFLGGRFWADVKGIEGIVLEGATGDTLAEALLRASAGGAEEG